MRVEEEEGEGGDGWEGGIGREGNGRHMETYCCMVQFHLPSGSCIVTLHTLAEKTAGVGGAVSRTGTAASPSTCTHHREKTNRTNWWSEINYAPG